MNPASRRALCAVVVCIASGCAMSPGGQAALAGYTDAQIAAIVNSPERTAADRENVEPAPFGMQRAKLDVTTLHRIEEAFLRSKVEAAGFKLLASAAFLRNPADPRDKEPMPKDEFILKFVKSGAMGG